MALIDDLRSELNPGCTMMVNNPDEEKMFLDYLTADMRVLEFGMGLSTLAIAKKVKEVVSLEYNHDFYKQFRGELPGNVLPLFVAPNIQAYQDDGSFADFENYIKAPMLLADTKFDVVFVDGRSRVNCAEYAANYYLKQGGAIFIHDYRHPQEQYRRPYLEEVETFLKLEEQVFTMARFTVIKMTLPHDIPAEPQQKPEHQKTIISDYQEPSEIQKVMNRQIAELGGTPWPTQGEIVEEIQEGKDESEIKSEVKFPEPEIINQQPVMQLPPIQPITSDPNSCWHQPSIIIEEMNRYYDTHIKHSDLTAHMMGIINLLKATDKQGSELIDLGCGTAMLSEFCKDFIYYGADLPHVIAGCAMRNFPRYYYRAVNVEMEDLSWISKYPVVVVNGVIDIMERPLEVLRRILINTPEYLIVHRQEITEKGETRSIQKPSYGGYTWHSIINRQDLVTMLDALNCDIVKEEKLSFGDWENGGCSFLVRKRKSWSLYNIDHRLYEKYFLGQENGFFVEAGANDGLRQSNTMYFEFYKNWRGILIEPVKQLNDLCRQNRSPKNSYHWVALVSDEYKDSTIGIFYTPENGGMLSVVDDENADTMLGRAPGETFQREQTQARSFNRMVDRMVTNKKIPVIDLMVLDIEGQELNALKGIDFEKYNIRYLLIEELGGGSEIADYLAPWYEIAESITDHDILYKRK